MVIGQSREIIEQHVHTHSEQSYADSSAVSTLRMFLRSNGKINFKFAEGDKWPNSDGLFELVLDPAVSRRPGQNFFVQIKGTAHYTETQSAVKYPLKNLAFPAFVACQKTLDPCILFLVLEPGTRGRERVFWKYMSVDFVNLIDYEKNSATISFTPDDEIKNTEESVNHFCDQLAEIADRHSFISRLNNVEYSRQDIERIIRACNEEITESIARMGVRKDTRDEVSRRMLTRLDDLCLAVLILNTLGDSSQRVSIRLAWERALLSAETQYLSTFYRGLQYIGRRIPDSGQSERLMLKY